LVKRVGLFNIEAASRNRGTCIKSEKEHNRKRESFTHQRQDMAASQDRPQHVAERPLRLPDPVLEWTSGAHLHKSYLGP